MSRARRFLLLSCGLIGTAANAQMTETSSLARPEPEITIIWLAPPPTDIAIEDQRLPVLTLVLPPPPNPNAVALPPAARSLRRASARCAAVTSCRCPRRMDTIRLLS